MPNTCERPARLFGIAGADRLATSWRSSFRAALRKSMDLSREPSKSVLEMYGLNDPKAKKHRWPVGLGPLWPPMFDRASIGRTRRALHPDLFSGGGHQQSDLGRSQRAVEENLDDPLPRQVDKPIHAGLLTDLKHRGLSRRNAHRLGRRIRPAAGLAEQRTAATTTPRASPISSPAAASRAARVTARPTSSATPPSRTPATSATCTPPCCTSWDWTITS